MSDAKRFDKVLQKFQEFKEQLSKYDEKRQDGVNVEPPMTPKEKTKKAEFLAMTKSGQWSLHKGDGKSEGSSPAKSENRKRFEKEVKDISPTGEDPGKAAEEVDSAEIKRKYRAGAGSGASENRLHKSDELEKGIKSAVKAAGKAVAQHVGDHVDLMVNPNPKQSGYKWSSQQEGRPNRAAKLFGITEKSEPQPGEAGHEDQEKKAAKDIKGKAEKLLDMHKMDEGTTLAGDYNATSIEKAGSCTGKQSCQCNECRQNRLAPVKKNDLPKDAEYQQHKKEAKERA